MKLHIQAGVKTRCVWPWWPVRSSPSPAPLHGWGRTGGRCGAYDWTRHAVILIDWCPSSGRWVMPRCWSLVTCQCCSSAWMERAKCDRKRKKRIQQVTEVTMSAGWANKPLPFCHSFISLLQVVSAYVMMRDFRLLMLGLGGWVMGSTGLESSDNEVVGGPSACSSASEEPTPWLWGSCSMVSCSSWLVSWSSKSIWRWKAGRACC